MSEENNIFTDDGDAQTPVGGEAEAPTTEDEKPSYRLPHERDDEDEDDGREPVDYLPVFSTVGKFLGFSRPRKVVCLGCGREELRAPVNVAYSTSQDAAPYISPDDLVIVQRERRYESVSGASFRAGFGTTIVRGKPRWAHYPKGRGFEPVHRRDGEYGLHAESILNDVWMLYVPLWEFPVKIPVETGICGECLERVWTSDPTIPHPPDVPLLNKLLVEGEHIDQGHLGLIVVRDRHLSHRVGSRRTGARGEFRVFNHSFVPDGNITCREMRVVPFIRPPSWSGDYFALITLPYGGKVTSPDHPDEEVTIPSGGIALAHHPWPARDGDAD